MAKVDVDPVITKAIYSALNRRITTLTSGNSSASGDTAKVNKAISEWKFEQKLPGLDLSNIEISPLDESVRAVLNKGNANGVVVEERWTPKDKDIPITVVVYEG